MIVCGGAREQKLHCNLFVFLKLIVFVVNVLVFCLVVYFFNFCFVLLFGHWPNATALSPLLFCIGKIKTVVHHSLKASEKSPFVLRLFHVSSDNQIPLSLKTCTDTILFLYQAGGKSIKDFITLFIQILQELTTLALELCLLACLSVW